jgi:hypothetical protein
MQAIPQAAHFRHTSGVAGAAFSYADRRDLDTFHRFVPLRGSFLSLPVSSAISAGLVSVTLYPIRSSRRVSRWAVFSGLRRS